MTNEMSVVWTADVIKLDCDVATEHEAAPCASGFIDPTWSMTTIDGDDRSQAAHFSPGPDDDPAEWLAAHIREHMGTPEHSSLSAWSWYGGAFQDGGCEVKLAAHASGFTAAQLEVADLLINSETN